MHSPLEVIDVQKLVDACTDKWWNQTLCKVNDSVVRLGVLEGKYHWHEHNDIDEFFFVLDGHFLIDLEDKVVDLGPRQGLLFQKGCDIARARRNAPSFLWSNERYRSYRRLKSPSRTGGIRSANLEKLQAISLPPQ